VSKYLLKIKEYHLEGEIQVIKTMGFVLWNSHTRHYSKLFLL